MVTSSTLNGQLIIGKLLSTSLSSGFKATSGNKIQLWTINTQAIDLLTSIGLYNLGNVQGSITFQLHDKRGGKTEVSGHNIGDLIPVNAENITKIVITSDTPTTDGNSPNGMKLILNGCITPTTLQTKAQVEDIDTTPIPGKHFV